MALAETEAEANDSELAANKVNTAVSMVDGMVG